MTVNAFSNFRLLVLDVAAQLGSVPLRPRLPTMAGKKAEKKNIKKVLREDEAEDSSSGDEEYDGVSEESMQKLIKVLGEDGLDQQALDQLAYLNQLEGVSCSVLLVLCSLTIYRLTMRTKKTKTEAMTTATKTKTNPSLTMKQSFLVKKIARTMKRKKTKMKKQLQLDSSTTKTKTRRTKRMMMRMRKKMPTLMLSH